MAIQSSVRFINKDKAIFFDTLKKRVDAYFKDNNVSPNANSTMVTKSIVLITGFILPYILLITFTPTFWTSMMLWSIMGFSTAGIGMSIMHDAIHGAYSNNKNVNYWMGNSLNLIGGSTFNWKLQHNVLHHTYTNIAGIDEDIQDRLVLRFNPHTEVKWYHKAQYVYAFFFYGILTLYWAVLKDFLQFAKYTSNGVNNNTRSENIVTFFKILGVKVVHFFIILVVPTVFFHIPFWEVITGFLVLHFIAGVVLTVVFQLAHTVEGTEHPLPDEKGNIDNTWAIHQINTTVNFSRKSKWISWYVGGLNFQIEHHLFPRICHVHYPEIAPIVKTTCEEFGIEYMENETFMQALDSHINTLVRFGRLPDINEAIA